MSHDITIQQDGTAEAAFALTPPWHGLGQLVDHTMSSEDAIQAAKLDWQVEKRTPKVWLKNAEGYESLDEAVDYAATVRVGKEGQADDLLGIVGKNYRAVQNKEAFRFLDSLQMDGVLKYEAAFSLRGGRAVVILAHLPKVDEIAEGDTAKRYILFSNHHDGSGGLKFGLTSVRVVCQNTFNLALQKDKGTIKALSIRHTSKLDDALNQARALIDRANRQFDEQAQQYRRMVERRIEDAQWYQFLDVVCPVPNKIDPDYTPQREKQIRQTRDDIERRYFHGELQNFSKQIERTAWAAFNSVSEKVDHMPRRGSSARQKAEARFNVALYGTGHTIKERAYQTALKLCEA